jgi:hypothetical protein
LEKEIVDRTSFMLVTRWETPVVVSDHGIRYSIGSAEEAMTWLMHERKHASREGRGAWEACKAARDGKLPAEEAKYAVELVVTSADH